MLFPTIAFLVCTALCFVLGVRSHWVGEPLRWFVFWLAAGMSFATLSLGSVTFGQPPSAMARIYITEFASVTGVALVIAAIAWLAELISRLRRAITTPSR